MCRVRGVDLRKATFVLVGFVTGLILLFISIMGQNQTIPHLATSDGIIHSVHHVSPSDGNLHGISSRQEKLERVKLHKYTDVLSDSEEVSTLTNQRTGPRRNWTSEGISHLHDKSGSQPDSKIDFWSILQDLMDESSGENVSDALQRTSKTRKTSRNLISIQPNGSSQNDIEDHIRDKRLSSHVLQLRTGESGHSETSWDRVQAERLLTVSDKCRRFHLRVQPSTTWRLLQDNDNMYVDSRHRLLYCAIPKAACSSWKAALALLSRQVSDPSRLNVHDHSYMSSLGIGSVPDLNLTDLQQVLAEYTKVMVVRHPLERLVSAYRDKFRTYNKWTRYFQLKYGRRIIRLYRGRNATTAALQRGHDVTFIEFLRYLVDETIPLEARQNPHWRSYQGSCHPCHVSYTHIIKFETMDEDNEIILKRYFSVTNSTAFFPRRNMKEVPSRDIMLRYYSDVPRDIMLKVCDMFRDDMKMYGYTLPQGLLEK